MKAHHEKGSRSIDVTDLPGKHGLSELRIKVSYTGIGGAIEGIALDHDIIPAIVDGLNRENLPPDALASRQKRRDAAAKWADEFNAPYLKSGKRPKGAKHKALSVIVLTSEIRDHLADTDPMALKQAQEALNGKSYVDYLTR